MDLDMTTSVEADVKEASKEIPDNPVIFEFESKPKQPKSAPSARRVAVKKDELRTAIGLMTLGAWALNRPDYALTDEEVDQLTDVWYDVIKEYPAVSDLLVKGKKITVWGRALVVTYMIVSKRIPAINGSAEQAKSKPETGAGTKPTNSNGTIDESTSINIDDFQVTTGSTYPYSGENG